MADWSKPQITSNYLNFVDEVKNRDIDSITLQLNPVTNPPVGSVRLLRSPVKFQEWDGSKFVDRVLSPEAGGTGTTSLSNLSGQLGLGSMAFQNSNAVNVTGGQLSGVTSLNTLLGGNCTFNGTSFLIASSTGNISLNVQGVIGQWTSMFVAPNQTNGSHGILITAGTTKNDNAFYVRNAASNKIGLMVRGDMGVFCSIGLVIPVGPGMFVPS